MSQAAISRHLNEHLAAYVQKALSEYGTSKGVKVLDKLTSTLERLDGFLDEAESKQDAREFVLVAGELRKELELLAKLQGELQQEGTTNITLNPEWLEIRAVIIGALEGHPDARESFLKALDEVGSGSH